jgi:hypothetical protein
MKTMGVVVLIASLLFVSVVPAAAQPPGVYLDPLGALLLFPFAVAATITGGVAAALTAPFTYPYAPYPAAYEYPYSYSDPYTYPLYPYSYRYWNPYAYAAPIYVDVSPPAPSYWYYCASTRTYYPYVSTCSEGWMQVVPTNR